MPEASGFTPTTAPFFAVGITRQRVYEWRRDVPSFADALIRAKEEAGDLLLSRLHAQALGAGTAMPDTVARIFLVKGYKPEFRDQVQVNHSGAILNAHVDLSTMLPADRVALLQLAAAAQERQGNVALPAPTDE